MGTNRGFAIAEGIAQGLEKAATNMYNIQQSQIKLKQEHELHDLEVKQAKLGIEKAKRLGEIEQKEVDWQLRNIGNFNKLKQAQYELASVQASTALTLHKKAFNDIADFSATSPNSPFKQKISGAGEVSLESIDPSMRMDTDIKTQNFMNLQAERKAIQDAVSKGFIIPTGASDGKITYGSAETVDLKTREAEAKIKNAEARATLADKESRGELNQSVVAINDAGQLVNFGSVPKGAKVLSTSSLGIQIPSDITRIPENATQEQKSDWLEQLDPSTQEIVSGLADYSLDISKVASLRGNQRKQLASLAKMYDPTFDMTEYPTRLKYKQNVTSGKIFDNKTRLNTLVQHLDYMDSTLRELKASNQPVANVVILMARKFTGDPAITDYETAKEVVDNEVQAALTGAAVTQEGVTRQHTILPEHKFGEKQAEQYINSLSHILKARLNVLESEYRQTMKKEPEYQIQTPETEAYFIKKFGGESISQGGVEMVDANGNRALVDPKTRKVIREL